MKALKHDEIAAEASKPMDYFPHDSAAYSDVKIRKLVRRCGMEGYGRWWRLCEILAATKGHRLCLSCEEEVEMLADDLMFDGSAELVDFLSTLSSVGLIDGFGDGEVWSARMLENSMKVGRMRAGGKMGGRPRKGLSEGE